MAEKEQKLSVQPYKGARDFFPEDMRVRNYIFDTWKRVCESYGFEEYDFPIIEPFEIFASKTGDEIVNSQIFSLVDKGGRKLAIRPELTPGTVRMIAQKYKQLSRPIKWFMVGNNWRFEKPQMGRGREFFQLEANIFGTPGVEADFEIFSLIISIMQAFGAKDTMFEIRISDRRLVNAFLDENLKLEPELQEKARRIMDKKSKMEEKDFIEALMDLGLNTSKAQQILDFMSCSFENLNISRDNEGYKMLQKLFTMLKNNGISNYVAFDPSIIRGFDYSDGIVYEVFDKNPKNKRSMFGGERFDKLINIFGKYELPATGFAMGDYTLLEFLKGWNLLPTFESETKYFMCLWPSDNPLYLETNIKFAQKLRNDGQNVFTWMENTKLEKQLKYANTKGYKYALIVGDEEMKNSTITVKNLQTGVQKTESMEKFLVVIK
jgi:histidyl-tRNA synthetase